MFIPYKCDKYINKCLTKDMYNYGVVSKNMNTQFR